MNEGNKNTYFYRRRDCNRYHECKWCGANVVKSTMEHRIYGNGTHEDRGWL